MIAKILSSASSFNGVNYNTNKIEKGDGELMLVANFGSLQGLPNLRPEDYKNYLKMVSATNERVKSAQFHAALSCEGKEYSKNELTNMAVEWMKKMGYGQQPFLVIFHNDTDNNHVHVVSTRIDQTTGKKVNDSFEKLKSYDAVQSLLNVSETLTIDLDKVKEFSFSTEAQFKLLLERKGYVLKDDKKENLEIIKLGRVQGKIAKQEIQLLTKEGIKDKKRIAQINAIILKYQKLYSSELLPVFRKETGGRDGKLIGYSSDLTDHLKKKFGIDIIFHFSNEKKPYGYTIIDQAQKNVFKGSEVLVLKELIKDSLILNDKWFDNVIQELKENNSGVLVLDELLGKNGLLRGEDKILNKNNQVVFKLEQNDLKYLNSVTKKSVIFTVYDESQKKALERTLGVPIDNILVDDNPQTRNNDTAMYSTLLYAAVHNYSTIEEGLDHLNISIVKKGNSYFIFGPETNAFVQLDNLVDKETQILIVEQFIDDTSLQGLGVEDHYIFNEDEFTENYSFDLMIADDIDDEQIHGRNRRRKGKARTNTR